MNGIHKTRQNQANRLCAQTLNPQAAPTEAHRDQANAQGPTHAPMQSNPQMQVQRQQRDTSGMGPERVMQDVSRAQAQQQVYQQQIRQSGALQQDGLSYGNDPQFTKPGLIPPSPGLNPPSPVPQNPWPSLNPQFSWLNPPSSGLDSPYHAFNDPLLSPPTSNPESHSAAGTHFNNDSTALQPSMWDEMRRWRKKGPRTLENGRTQ